MHTLDNNEHAYYCDHPLGPSDGQLLEWLIEQHGVDTIMSLCFQHKMERRLTTSCSDTELRRELVTPDGLPDEF